MWQTITLKSLQMWKYLHERSWLDLAFFQKPPAPEKRTNMQQRRQSAQLKADKMRRWLLTMTILEMSLQSCGVAARSFTSMAAAQHERTGPFTSGLWSRAWSRPTHAPIRPSASKNRMQRHDGRWEIISQKRKPQGFAQICFHGINICEIIKTGDCKQETAQKLKLLSHVPPRGQ